MTKILSILRGPPICAPSLQLRLCLNRPFIENSFFPWLEFQDLTVSSMENYGVSRETVIKFGYLTQMKL